MSLRFDPEKDWIYHTEWHYGAWVGNNKLDYWPTKFKWRYKKEIHKGFSDQCVLDFIAKEEDRILGVSQRKIEESQTAAIEAHKKEFTDQIEKNEILREINNLKESNQELSRDFYGKYRLALWGAWVICLGLFLGMVWAAL